MVSQISHAHRWLIEYADRLVRLHRLIAQDQGDSEVADALRDEMDLPWRKMTDAEIDLVKGLSADLYKLIEPSAETPAKDNDSVNSILAAMKDDKWQSALELIRQHEHRLPSAISSYWRGTCWAGLGVYGAAAEFFGHAATLHSSEPLFWTLWMDALMSDNQEVESLRVAEQAMAASSAPEVLLKAAVIMFHNAELASGESAEALHRRAMEIADRGLELVAASGSKAEQFQREIVAVHLHRAMSLASIGKLKEARSACDLALRTNPNSLDAPLVLGYLEEQAHRPGIGARLQVARTIVPSPADRTFRAKLVPDDTLWNPTSISGLQTIE